MTDTKEDGECVAGPSDTQVIFKKRGVRAKANGSLRGRRSKSPDDGRDASGQDANDHSGGLNEEIGLEDLVALRALKQRAKGIDLQKLNRGDVQTRKTKKEATATKGTDQVKEERWAEQMRRGGLMVTARDDSRDANAHDTEDDEEQNDAKDSVRLVNRNNFQGETGTVDVNKHMMAYIEEEMRKRRQGQAADQDVISAAQTIDNPEDELYRVAEKYRQIQQAAKDAIALDRSRINAGAVQWKGISQSSQQASENEERDEGNAALSTTMLTGIPEVDLGIDVRLQNIEATEKARQKLETERAKRQRPHNDGDDFDDDVAAVRFFRHRNRVATDAERTAMSSAGEALEESLDHTELAQPMAAPTRRSHQTATDDAALERFKKRQRNQLKR